MTDEARAGEPRTEAGRALMRIGQEWAIRGSRASRTIEHEQGWTDGTYQTNEELFRRIVLAIEREAAAELWQQGYAAGLERGRQPDNHPSPSLDGFEAQLAEALPWVIVPLSDPEDPLAMMRWTDDQGKQPDWRMVARRLRERLEAQGRLSESAPPVAPLGETGVTE